MSVGVLKGILCVSQYGYIGNGGDLMYTIPSDMKRFKSLTSGCPVIMGSGTARSLPKALPNRENIVVSESGYQRDGFVTIGSIEEFMDRWDRSTDAWFIGGAKMFVDIFDLVDEWKLTMVYDDAVGDTKVDLSMFDGMRCDPERMTTHGDMVVEFLTYSKR